MSNGSQPEDDMPNAGADKRESVIALVRALAPGESHTFESGVSIVREPHDRPEKTFSVVAADARRPIAGFVLDDAVGYIVDRMETRGA